MIVYIFCLQTLVFLATISATNVAEHSAEHDKLHVKINVSTNKTHGHGEVNVSMHPKELHPTPTATSTEPIPPKKEGKVTILTESQVSGEKNPQEIIEGKNSEKSKISAESIPDSSKVQHQKTSGTALVHPKAEKATESASGPHKLDELSQKQQFEDEAKTLREKIDHLTKRLDIVSKSLDKDYNTLSLPEITAEYEDKIKKWQEERKKLAEKVKTEENITPEDFNRLGKLEEKIEHKKLVLNQLKEIVSAESTKGKSLVNKLKQAERQALERQKNELEEQIQCHREAIAELEKKLEKVNNELARIASESKIGAGEQEKAKDEISQAEQLAQTVVKARVPSAVYHKVTTPAIEEKIKLHEQTEKSIQETQQKDQTLAVELSKLADKLKALQSQYDPSIPDPQFEKTKVELEHKLLVTEDEKKKVAKYLAEFFAKLSDLDEQLAEIDQAEAAKAKAEAENKSKEAKVSLERAEEKKKEVEKSKEHLEQLKNKEQNIQEQLEKDPDNSELLNEKEKLSAQATKKQEDLEKAISDANEEDKTAAAVQKEAEDAARKQEELEKQADLEEKKKKEEKLLHAEAEFEAAKAAKAQITSRKAEIRNSRLAAESEKKKQHTHIEKLKKSLDEVKVDAEIKAIKDQIEKSEEIVKEQDKKIGDIRDSETALANDDKLAAENLTRASKAWLALKESTSKAPIETGASAHDFEDHRSFRDAVNRLKMIEDKVKPFDDKDFHLKLTSCAKRYWTTELLLVAIPVESLLLPAEKLQSLLHTLAELVVEIPTMGSVDSFVNLLKYLTTTSCETECPNPTEITEENIASLAHKLVSTRGKVNVPISTELYQKKATHCTRKIAGEKPESIKILVHESIKIEEAYGLVRYFLKRAMDGKPPLAERIPKSVFNITPHPARQLELIYQYIAPFVDYLLTGEIAIALKEVSRPIKSPARIIRTYGTKENVKIFFDKLFEH